MDSEKGNRVFARGGGGTMCPPPWFLEPKKSLVWIGLTKKSATLESFLPRAIILWNDLPTNVQSSKTLSTFKTKLRVHLSL